MTEEYRDKIQLLWEMPWLKQEIVTSEHRLNALLVKTVSQYAANRGTIADNLLYNSQPIIHVG
jgi:hypothetical protein